jgi:UrcA family protein
MKQTLQIILISFLATAAVIKAAPAFSEPVQNVSVVPTADLNLSTDAGLKALDHRLVIAAYDVCGPASDADLAGKNAVRQCRARVLSKARSDAQQIANSTGSGSILVAAAH